MSQWNKLADFCNGGGTPAGTFEFLVGNGQRKTGRVTSISGQSAKVKLTTGEKQSYSLTTKTRRSS
ncbi:hypothetical protein KKF61_00425 [Patescibacteria group bacterium]|nr:hypothetical protein [Patescibacteria group bacterium]